MPSFNRKRTFALDVTTANQSVTKEFPMFSDMDTVIAISVTGNRRDLTFNRGTLGVTIGGKEIIVEGEDASEYIFGIEHPGRAWFFGEHPLVNTDKLMKVRYTDSDAPGAAFSAYKVKVTLTYRTNS